MYQGDYPTIFSLFLHACIGKETTSSDIQSLTWPLMSSVCLSLCFGNQLYTKEGRLM